MLGGIFEEASEKQQKWRNDDNNSSSDNRTTTNPPPLSCIQLLYAFNLHLMSQLTSQACRCLMRPLDAQCPSLFFFLCSFSYLSIYLPHSLSVKKIGQDGRSSRLTSMNTLPLGVHVLGQPEDDRQSTEGWDKVSEDKSRALVYMRRPASLGSISVGGVFLVGRIGGQVWGKATNNLRHLSPVRRLCRLC
ncbi:hypothetical protein BKA81DRAFT_50635 [Phyllosticta paracitricarpa]